LLLLPANEDDGPLTECDRPNPNADEKLDRDLLFVPPEPRVPPASDTEKVPDCIWWHYHLLLHNVILLAKRYRHLSE